MNITLRDVLMDAVVGQEASGGGAVPLGVDVLHVVVDVGQQLRAALHGVLMRDTQVGESGAKLRGASSAARERILQGEDQRHSPGISFPTRGWRQGLSPTPP